MVRAAGPSQVNDSLAHVPDDERAEGFCVATS